MSHLGIYNSTISVPASMEVAQQALKLLASELKVEIKTKIRNVYGVRLHQDNCNVGILHIKNGLGIHIDEKDKSLKFVGDSYGAIREFKQIQQRFEELYKLVGISVVMKKMGYSITTNRSTNLKTITGSIGS